MVTNLLVEISCFVFRTVECIPSLSGTAWALHVVGVADKYIGIIYY